MLNSAELGASDASLSAVYLINAPNQSFKYRTEEEIIKQKPTSFLSACRQHFPVTLSQAGRESWEGCGERALMEQREV